MILSCFVVVVVVAARRTMYGSATASGAQTNDECRNNGGFILLSTAFSIGLGFITAVLDIRWDFDFYCF